MSVPQTNKAKLVEALLLFWRYGLIMPTLGVALVTFSGVVLAMIWWYLAGWTCRILLGKKLGVPLARYIGCYPFLYVLLGWAGIIAVFIWASGRRPYLESFGMIAEGVQHDIVKHRHLRHIGGLW